MNKKQIISLGISFLVIVSTVAFLPNLLWRYHLQPILSIPEERVYSVPEGFQTASPKKLADLIYTGKLYTFDKTENELIEKTETAKQLLRSFFEFITLEAKEFYLDLLDGITLEYIDSKTHIIESNSGLEYYILSDIVLTNPEKAMTVSMCYEQKTHTIISLEIYFRIGKELMEMDVLSKASAEYYASLKIEKDRFFSKQSENWFITKLLSNSNEPKENKYDVFVD